MDKFNREDKIRELLKAFEQTDEFYAEFKTSFTIEMFMLIRVYYPTIKATPTLDHIIDIYANEIISITESVIDKDINYPEYRKAEELDRLTKLIKKEPVSKEHPEFIERTHLKAKELMVQFYSDIQDLSSEGFMLLELNAKQHHNMFIGNFTHREKLALQIEEHNH